MRYVVEHESRLAFPHSVREHQCEMRLAPRDDEQQAVQALRIETEPPATLYGYTDCYGNRVHAFGIVTPHRVLVTRMRAEVETKLENPFDYEAVPPNKERDWVAQCLRAQPRLWDYVLHRSPATPEMADVLPDDLVCPAFDPDRRLLDSVMMARDWIADTIAYRSGATHVHSALAEAIEKRAGVCQDFAHLLIAIVRGWGFLARYVTGYLDPGYVVDGAATAAESIHAWAEVLIPGAGWRGFDATAGLVVNDTYVAVAVGRDYLDANPQRGTFKGDDEGDAPEVMLRVARGDQ